MSMIGIGAGWPRLGAFVLAASMAMPGAASAQLFFDWGGSEQKVNDSGRQLVKVNIDAKPGEIIVSFTDRKLYLMTGPGQALSYPVAIPREQDRWEGKTTVTQKRENPSWTPTPTMIKENPRLPRWVPGGHPMNPLGNRALYLGSSFYRIHGTDAPWTIGTAVSKGCIRMYNQDALDVYERTKVGAKVLVTWNQYQSTLEAQQPQALSEKASQTPQPAQMSSRGESSSQASTGAPRQASVPARSAERPVQATSSRAKADTRYSDVFGTSGPNDLPSFGTSDPAPAAAAPIQQQRQTRTRDGQHPRESRRAREAAAPLPSAEHREQAATTSDHHPPVARTSEPRQQRSAPVETGAISGSRPRVKAVEVKTSEPAEGTRTTATKSTTNTASSNQPAAAAERAERAASSHVAAPEAPVSTFGGD